MGCEQSTPEKVIPPKSGTKANGSSSAGSSHSAHRNRHADKAHVEALTAFAKDWAARRGLDDKDFDVNSIIADCSSYFRAWPRGDKAGMFLHAPVASGLPLPERGVALSWLNEAWNRIKAEAGKGSIPTRAFVEFFVRPLLLDHAADVTLFDFVPLAFRAKPYVYLSHSWDGWLRQAFFLPEATVRDWPENAAVWMDVFAINQVEDIPRNFMVKEIGQVVASIANTLLVLPGDGMPSFALLPAMRSWCMYEMAMTPANCMSYRMGMHGDLGDAEFVSWGLCMRFQPRSPLRGLALLLKPTDPLCACSTRRF
jgi:hypothetical protein